MRSLRVIRWLVYNVRVLQAIAAVLAILTAAYSLSRVHFIARFFEPAVPVIQCVSLTVKDGDSLDCDGQELRLIGDGIPGLVGIDAPETEHAKCEKERDLGLQVKRVIAEYLPQLERIEDTKIRDPFLRPLVRLRMRDGQLIESMLLSYGLAVVWTPGYVPHWCDEIGQSYQ